ncbi:MAG: fatty acid hydroxylase [Panacagrimonas sp.]|jgi:sterol desaturase/sphingolipid hydroxylase (fatty acid hydroxylase superfamily)|nr:sterol desaturase family protein [Panacagrimonas sp.]MCC2656821.1 fatty acid hydroxylase [Panacagrimonas sp.]
MQDPPALAELLRPALFFALLVVVSVCEQWRPLRLSDPQRLLRWPANFGLVAIGLVLVAALPMSMLAASHWAKGAGFGLFNLVEAPVWVEGTIAWLLLDLAMYALHRALHEVRWLWPLHRVHHSDVEFDVTTGLRFHPAELLLSQLFRLGLVMLLGAPLMSVLAYELAFAAFLLFQHANFRLAGPLERILRLLLVTPDMHRTHHSVHRDETDSNYGFVLSLWDRVFRSYRRAARDAPRQMRIGLSEFRVPEQQTLRALLTQPLERQ